MRLDVRTNFGPIERKLRALQADIRERAVARALNRTAEQGRTRMNREITREFNIPSSEVRSELDLRRARPGGGTAYLVVEINALKSRRNRGARATASSSPPTVTWKSTRSRTTVRASF